MRERLTANGVASCPDLIQLDRGVKRVAEKRPDGEPAVAMADLFAFARRARVVSDGNFGNLLAHAAEFCGDFGTELKALAFEVNLRDQRAAEDFIASGLVVDARAVKQISQMSQKLCTEEKSKSALGAGIHDEATCYKVFRRSLIAQIDLECQAL